ncbi:MAG: Gfo/Idh/MocA family oxidoreductase [Brevinema sp.]
MSKLNIALIGVGRIGLVHLKSLSTLLSQEVNIHTLCDPQSLELEKYAIIHGAKAERDITVVCNDSEVDALVICTPTHQHYEHIKMGLKAKKHIFCEKPISTTVTEVLDIAELTEKFQKKLLVAYNRRFDINYRRVHDIIQEGKIGKLQLIHATNYDHPTPSAAYLLNSGTVFLDQIIHDYDLTYYLSKSEPVAVCAMGGVHLVPELTSINGADVSSTLVYFENSVVASIDSACYAAYGYDQRVEALGSTGGVWSENRTENDVRYSESGGTISDNPLPGFLTRYMDSYANEVKSFVNSVINDKPSELDALESLYSIKIGLAAKRSFQEKRIVEISEIKPE